MCIWLIYKQPDLNSIIWMKKNIDKRRRRMFKRAEWAKWILFFIQFESKLLRLLFKIWKSSPKTVNILFIKIFIFRLCQFYWLELGLCFYWVVRLHWMYHPSHSQQFDLIFNRKLPSTFPRNNKTSTYFDWVVN